MVVGALACLALLATPGTFWLGFRLNLTASMPIGIYRVTSPRTVISKGMMISVCPPLPAATVGRERAYLFAGPCPGATEPLLKVVAATAGDHIVLRPSGVLVNGRLLPHSRTLNADRAGRPLLPWRTGPYLLRGDALWIYAPNERSWDSRYWGPASIKSVLAVVRPVLAFGQLPASAIRSSRSL